MAVYPPSGSGGAHMDKAISKETKAAKATQTKKKATSPKKEK